MRLQPMTFGRQTRSPKVDDTAERTAIGCCTCHGQQTVMRVRGRWGCVCCGREAPSRSPHPVSVLDVPFLDNVGLIEAQDGQKW